MMRIAWTALAFGLALSCSSPTECAEDSDCGDDSYCERVDFAGCAPPSSECKPREGRGGPCSYSGHCLGGLVCHEALGSTCQPASPLGGPCSTAADCGVDPFEPPPPGAPICDLQQGSGVCAAEGSVPEGGRCLEHRSCADGLACRGIDWDSEWFCAAPGGLGEPCLFDPGEGPVPKCEEGLVCSTALDPRSCALPAPEGGICNYRHECAAGLACFGGRCEPAHGAGGSCEYPEHCLDGYRCNGQTRICEPIE